MKKNLLLLLSYVLLLSFFTAPAFAALGVGVASGKIVVDEILKPGMRYNLPPLTVLNTGDEDARYQVDTAYHQDQSENMPSREWFTFTPNEFDLSAGESQVVKIQLELPIKTVPGDYFAYLEAHPIQKSVSGTTTIGIAAAAKLYFEVAPANVLAAISYRAVSLWNNYFPWPAIVLGILVLILLRTLVVKFFNIDIKINTKGSNSNEEKETTSLV